EIWQTARCLVIPAAKKGLVRLSGVAPQLFWWRLLYHRRGAVLSCASQPIRSQSRHRDVTTLCGGGLVGSTAVSRPVKEWHLRRLPCNGSALPVSYAPSVSMRAERLTRLSPAAASSQNPG